MCALQSLCHAVPGISDVETTSASLSAGSVMPTMTAVITRMRRAAVSAGDVTILGATRAAMPVRSFGFKNANALSFGRFASICEGGFLIKSTFHLLPLFPQLVFSSHK